MKRFAQLSKKIKEILDMLAKQGTAENEDDAMFTKRHLGPHACASCEKNLINIYGQAVDHYPWKKLPFRDPNERLARYGQGFSKILSNMKPVEVSGYHHQSVDDAGVNYHGSHSTYPETMANGSEQGFKTTTGFFRNEKTQHGNRKHAHSIHHDDPGIDTFRGSAGPHPRHASNNPSHN